MVVDAVRWRNIREFLDDLPEVHCTTKPEHEFCTVCMRINYIIASNCPLYHVKPKRKRRAVAPAVEEQTEPLKDHLSVDDVKLVLKGEDFPIIEFGGSRGVATRAEEEEVLDVAPLEVVPIETSKTITRAKKAEMRREVPPAGAAEGRTAPAPGPDRDPESIVQEIMEELEFPDERELEEGEEPPEDEPEDEEAEGEGPEEGPEDGDADATSGPDAEGAPETDADDGELEGEAKKGPPPVVVQKQAVRKLKPKSPD